MGVEAVGLAVPVFFRVTLAFCLAVVYAIIFVNHAERAKSAYMEAPV